MQPTSDELESAQAEAAEYAAHVERQRAQEYSRWCGEQQALEHERWLETHGGLPAPGAKPECGSTDADAPCAVTAGQSAPCGDAATSEPDDASAKQ